MQWTSLLSRGENTIEASVTIQRAVSEVFRFYRDFKNLPSFLGDVMAIEQIGPATSRWTIQARIEEMKAATNRVLQIETNSIHFKFRKI